MRCEQIREKLATPSAGEPALGESVALREHLSGCPSCAQYSHELERVESLCTLWPEVEPTPTFEARFWAALDARTVSPPARWIDRLSPWMSAFRAPHAAAVAAMFLATVAASVWLLRAPSDPGSLVAPEVAQVPFSEFLKIKEEEDKLKDFDVIANLELLEHFDEVKSQPFKKNDVPQ